MGMHFLDIIIIAGVVLALFGSKSLHSMARSAGKTASQAKSLKDKVMSELPMEEIMKVTEHLPQVPLNSRQALQMLLTSGETDAPAGTTVKTAEHAEGTNAPEKSSDASPLA